MIRRIFEWQCLHSREVMRSGCSASSPRPRASAATEPFTGDLLVELGRLVEADWVYYNELDRLRRARPLLLEVERTDDSEVDDRGLVTSDAGAPHLPAPPARVLRRPEALGLPDPSASCTARRFYDVVVPAVRHRARAGGRHPLPAVPLEDVLLRPGRGTFSERDRLVLDLLQPHLARLWEAARTRRELAAALVGLDQAEAHESRGVILLGARGEVEYASSRRGACPRVRSGRVARRLARVGCPRPLVHRSRASAG